MKRFQKFQLPLPLTLLAAVLLTGCVTILALWCQPNALRSVLANFKAQPLLIVLNALPVGLLLLAFTCLFRNVFFGAALANVLVCGLSLGNRIKIEVRDEPVFARDLALLKEVAGAMGAYDIQYPWGVIAAILITTLVLIVLGVLIGCKPLSLAPPRVRRTGAFTGRERRGLRWLPRLLGAGASLGVLTALILTVYASNTLYDSFRTSNPYYIPSVFNELGFPYCFCHHFTTYPVDRPEGFSRSEAEAWQNGPVVTDQGKPVNVIMVMNEAFTNLADDPAFTYTEENDPLPNFHAMQADPHAITGRIVVPTFAGGTANTEFDILTGIQTITLSAATTSSFRVVNRDLDSLFRVFGDDGYHTSFFHPGDDWFYNRENVYRWMGAEETKFIDQMPDARYKGASHWVEDDYLAGLIEKEFDETVDAGGNLFHYTTTIQNHMSYIPTKYGEGYAFPPLETDAELSEQARSILEVYIEGTRDADAMLGRLRNYFDRRQEPVVLVFFGDHLPYLGDGQLAYGELGNEVALPEGQRQDILIAYKTPYVIWANDAAAEALEWESAVEALDIPGHGDLSAAFLGAAVLELTGRGEQNPWFGFLNQLRREAPVIYRQILLQADGTSFVTDGAARAGLGDTVAKWRKWSFYKLKYQEFD